MPSASRESLAAALERLDTLAAQRGVDLSAVAAELFAVTDLLDREPAMRRALAEPSTPPAAREGLAERLLARQVGTPTLDVLRALVQSRWSAAGDLADAVEQLGVQAALTVAERDGSLDDVEDELFRFARTVDREHALRAALADPRLPAERRLGLLDRLLAERVRPTSRLLVERVVAHPRGRTLETALEELSKRAAQRRERILAEVRVAAPLDDAQLDRLAQSLERLYGRPVSVQVALDPDLLGGAVVRVGDEVIDGTVVRRLADVRARLARRTQ